VISRIRASALVLSGALALAASGCMSSDEPTESADGFDAISEAAADEGSVTWYVSIPEAVAKNVADAFEAEYDIPVEMVVLSSGLLATRYASEMDSGQSPADVVTLADPLFFQDAVEKDWVDGLDEEDAPALADWPADGVNDDAYVLVNIQPIGVTYDTTKADASEFEDWDFLNDPAYRDQVYLVDPTNIPAWLANMQLLEKTYGADFLSGIADLNPKVVDSAVPGAQQVAAGSGTLVYPSLLTVSLPLSSQGATVDTAFPQPTTGVEQYAAVSAKAPQPNAARLFMNYLMTEEAQTVLNKDTGSSPLGDLPGTLPLPEGYESVDFAAAVEDKDSILGQLGLG
jgi:iron(III) transport system substrate-binding protein